MILINLLEKKSKVELFLALFNFLYVELVLFGLAIIITVSVSLLISKNLHYELSIITAERNKLNQQLVPLQRTKAKMINFNKNKEDLLKKINTILNLKREESFYFKILTGIEESNPDDCWITSFRYGMSKNGRSRLNMEISTLRASSINQFITNMKVSGIFKNIILAKVEKEREQDKKKQFNVEINEFNINAEISRESPI